MRHSLYVTASILAFAMAPSARAEAPFDFAHAPGKLPKTVVPTAYTIDIAPDLAHLSLTGSVQIDIDVTRPTTTITLNQADLSLTAAMLADGPQARITEDNTAQTATLSFDKPVAAGKHTLFITYRGKIPQTPAGIYYDDYKTKSGKSDRMLVTQFESTDARRMFPVWDEPAFKASFQLQVTLPRDLTAMSNMPVEKTTPVMKDLQQIDFARTPRMSSYLLALVAGHISSVDGAAAGVAMHAFAPTGEQDQAKYALSAEESILPFYNDYFGVKFPLPKLDMVAIPGNYEAGAMENWGAITYIDNAMLFDPAISAPATRQSIFYVVAHEMAHQWSGDLVTMGWWDNIWLNEGFATWMGWKATDHFNPSWEIWARRHQDREVAMGQDAVPSTHPVHQVVHDETEAASAFDGISYQKGSQVIRMIEDWIGPDQFRAGMRAYMAAHQYNNTTSADLWAAISAAAHRDVTPVALSFTEQPGIPLVHVARACSGGHASLTLTQDRFTIHDPQPKPERWTIPVTLRVPGKPASHLLLADQPVTLTLAGCATPAKLNWGENGYYRTHYDAASLHALAAALPGLPAVDRANLLGDQFALFTANRAPLSEYLDLLAADKNETDIAVWDDTTQHLAVLNRVLRASPVEAKFHAFSAGLLRPALARLGWDARPNEPVLNTLLRPMLIAALGAVDDTATIAAAQKRFTAFLAKPDSLAPALREAVLDIVGHHADQKTYDALKNLGLNAPSTEEKLRYFNAMAAAADPALLAQTVAFAPSGAIPPGRILRVLQRASGLSGQADLLYKLTIPHEAEYAARTVQGGIGPTALAAAASGSSNPETARALLAAPSSQASRGAKIIAARTADAILTRAEMRERAEPALTAWLAGTK